MDTITPILESNSIFFIGKEYNTMINIFRQIGNLVRKEPGLTFFINQIGSSEHIYRQGKVKTIQSHLLRQHNVLNRVRDTYSYKGKTFTPAAVLLQGLKTIVNFHVAYLVGNPVSLTGTPKVVEEMNKVYRNGLYEKTDWKILNELITYGNAFEYVYLDENRKIRSKVFRNKDSYPIYDDNNEYRYFVEYWKNAFDGDEHYVIYYPTHVDTYFNSKLVDSKPNLTGLPIHYVTMDESDYSQFGDSFMLDLIPIMDKIEYLISKLDDAITTLSLNPLLSITGANLGEKDMIDSNIAGAVINLDEGCEAKYVNAVMDYNCIKYELDQLYQNLNMIAAVPSSILGQSNISNVSENTTSIIYQLTENRGKQNIMSLVDGFKSRWEKIRTLLAITGVHISDEDFESLNVSFNINRPVDTKNDFANMKIQYECGAISKRTFIEKSPYTGDSAQELQRLADENKDIFEELPEAETTTEQTDEV